MKLHDTGDTIAINESDDEGESEESAAESADDEIPVSAAMKTMSGSQQAKKGYNVLLLYKYNFINLCHIVCKPYFSCGK